MAPSAQGNPTDTEPYETRLDAASLTDVGQAREKNEDNLGEANPQESGRGWLYVVADGMGGAAAGQTASTMAVATTKEAYKEFVKTNPRASTFDALSYAVEAANTAIYERAHSDQECYGMGTTIVAMAVVGNMAYTAHVGDSRIYRYRDGRLEKMMNDHTRVQDLCDQGIISPAEAEDHPESHVINRNLGGRAEIEVDTPEDGPFVLREGDTYLLCSDGLHGLVPDESIRKILDIAPPTHAAPALIELANRRGGYDNITVSLVCAGQGPVKWQRFNPNELSSTLDQLAFDDASDTALFHAYDDEALGPNDFDTQQLRAIIATGSTVSFPTVQRPDSVDEEDEGEKKLTGKVQHTVALNVDMAALRAAQQNAAAAAPSKVPTEVMPTANGSKGPPWLLIGLAALLFFMLIGVVIIMAVVLS